MDISAALLERRWSIYL